uniref:thiamine pyrophosphate-binding protein n=1 Tax=Microbacterium sp. TaxID=51671 RepID=UPI0028A8780C
MTGSPASDAAADLLAELIAHGVRDLVLSPGSRSQALALAATALARTGAMRSHVRIDERAAGFTALGLARETGAPVAVVCTSGTAAGNLLPAAMEAYHSGVPLLLLTADRPPELRGVGANQATVQPGIFGPFVRLHVDADVPDSVDAASEIADGSVPRGSVAGEHAGARADDLRSPTAWSGLGERAVRAALGLDGGGLAGVCGPVHLNLPS